MTDPKHAESDDDKPIDPLVEAGWKIESGEQLALALEQILAAYGLAISSGSGFEKHVLQAMSLAEQRRSGGAGDEENEIRPRYPSLVGVREIAKLVLEVKDSPSFPALVPHLRLLSEGSGIQNAQSSVLDQATNKLFELVAGTLALQCGTGVLLDDPVRPTGKNPDVLATICGRRWGIACKVLHSRNTESFVAHLTRGIEQIESSEAETGVVFINTKNVLSHDEIWPLARVDRDVRSGLGPAAWPDPRDTVPLAPACAAEHW